jgi:hypothetical protein
MARRKTQPEAIRTKYDLAERLRLIRTELYGERGGPELARRLGVPIRTWYNYESGVTVPSEVLLRFIELTSVEPVWLLHGREPRFRVLTSEETVAASSSVEALLRSALQRLESRAIPSMPCHAQRPPIEGTDSATCEGRHAPAGRMAGAMSSVEGVRLPPGLMMQPDWVAAHHDGRCVRVESDAMVPIVANGAFVAFAETDQACDELEGKLVVAWVEGSPIVRWFEKSGRYALLRAENPVFEPPMTLVDLNGPPEARRLRRVLWIGTPH